MEKRMAPRSYDKDGHSCRMWQHEKRATRWIALVISLLHRLVFELRGQTFAGVNIITRPQIYRLIQGMAFPVGVKIPHLHNRADFGNVVIGRDGDVAARNQASAFEQTDLHAPPGI